MHKNAVRTADIFYPWEVEQIIGLPATTLRSWRRAKIFEPSEDRHELRFRFYDLCLLSCAVKLLQLGASTQSLRSKYFPELRRLVNAAIADGYALTDLKFTLMPGKTPMIYSSLGTYTAWTPKFVLDFGELDTSVKGVRPLLTYKKT